MTFLQFKTSIRTFEENERASFHNSLENTAKQLDGIMNLQQSNIKQQNRRYFQPDMRTSQNKPVGGIICTNCKGHGHKSDVCPTNDKIQTQQTTTILSKEGRNTVATTKPTHITLLLAEN